MMFYLNFCTNFHEPATNNSSKPNRANSNGLSYTIYVAKAIRPGFDITLSVSVSNSKNPVLADALLSSSDGEIYFQETVVIQSGTPPKYFVLTKA